MKKILIIVLSFFSLIHAQGTIQFLSSIPKPTTNITDPNLLYHYIIYNKDIQNYNESLRAASKFVLLFFKDQRYSEVRTMIPEIIALDGDIEEAVKQLDVLKDRNIIKSEKEYLIKKSNLYFVNHNLEKVSILYNETHYYEIGIDLFYLYMEYGKYKKAKKLCGTLAFKNEMENDIICNLNRYKSKKRWKKINIFSFLGLEKRSRNNKEGIENIKPVIYQSLFMGIQGLFLTRDKLNASDYIFIAGETTILSIWRYHTNNTNTYKLIRKNYNDFCADYSRENLRFQSKY